MLRSSLFAAIALATWAVPNLRADTTVACYTAEASVSNGGPTLALCNPNEVMLNGVAAQEYATAEAHYGLLRAQVAADNGPGYPVNGSAGLRAWAWAGFYDTFTLTATNPFNGSITFSMALDSTSDGACYSVAPWSCDLGNDNIVSFSSTWGQDPGSAESAVKSEAPPEGASTFSLTNSFYDYQWTKSGDSYILNDMFFASFSANAECQIYSGWCAADNANHWDTGRMTGVVIADAAGNPVQGVLLTSDSGTDYNNIPDVKYDYITPLPEAGGLAGLIGAIVALLWWKKTASRPAHPA